MKDSIWSVSLQGSRAGVTAAIAKREDISPHWKDLLKAEIAGVGAEFNFIKLDAQYHLVSGRSNIHLSIIPSTVL